MSEIYGIRYYGKRWLGENFKTGRTENGFRPLLWVSKLDRALKFFSRFEAQQYADWNAINPDYTIEVMMKNNYANGDDCA